MPPPSRRRRHWEKQPTNTVCLTAAHRHDISVVVTSASVIYDTVSGLAN